MFGYTIVATFLRGLFNDLEKLITFPYMGFNKAFIVEAISEFNLAYVETNVPQFPHYKNQIIFSLFRNIDCKIFLIFSLISTIIVPIHLLCVKKDGQNKRKMIMVMIEDSSPTKDSCICFWL